jgi:putative RNA 2'-phosphotransferase
VVLVVRALQMHRAGFRFYLSESGVWLTERVPPAYLSFPQTA